MVASTFGLSFQYMQYGLLAAAECDQQANDTYCWQAGEEGSCGGVQADPVIHGRSQGQVSAKLCCTGDHLERMEHRGAARWDLHTAVSADQRQPSRVCCYSSRLNDNSLTIHVDCRYFIIKCTSAADRKKCSDSYSRTSCVVATTSKY